MSSSAKSFSPFFSNQIARGGDGLSREDGTKSAHATNLALDAAAVSSPIIAGVDGCGHAAVSEMVVRRGQGQQAENIVMPNLPIATHTSKFEPDASNATSVAMTKMGIKMGGRAGARWEEL